MKSPDVDGSQTGETLARSIVKTVSYRVLVIVIDFAVLYFLTGRPSLAMGFTIVSNIYTTVTYLIHERIWERVRWGRRALSGAQIGRGFGPP